MAAFTEARFAATRVNASAVCHTVWHVVAVDASDLGFIVALSAIPLGMLTLTVVLALRIRRRTTARYREAEMFECGLRVVSGQLPGLSRRWRHGLAGVHDGVLVFGQGRLGGYVRGRAPHVPDVRIDGPLRWDRTPRPKERLALARRTQVFTAPQPDGAVVEVVVLTTHAPGLQAKLAS